MAVIVIIEDNSLNLKLFTDLLVIKGHTVHSTNQGEEAIKLIAENKPDIAIIDIQLPHISGLEIIKAIRKHTDDTINAMPCIAITAFAFREDQQDTIDAGFDLFLSKPIDVEKFYSSVDTMLEKATPKIQAKERNEKP
jgi:two-component system cell cycle response regulator DivK